VRAYYNLEELWGEGKFDRPANPTSLAGGRLAHAAEDEEEHPSLPHGKPKPRAKSAATTRRKPAATGAAPRTKAKAGAQARTGTRKTAATATGAARPRRRKPAA
jgi:hypothetical protein